MAQMSVRGSQFYKRLSHVLFRSSQQLSNVEVRKLSWQMRSWGSGSSSPAPRQALRTRNCGKSSDLSVHCNPVASFADCQSAPWRETLSTSAGTRTNTWSTLDAQLPAGVQPWVPLISCADADFVLMFQGGVHPSSVRSAVEVMHSLLF